MIYKTLETWLYFQHKGINKCIATPNYGWTKADRNEKLEENKKMQAEIIFHPGPLINTISKQWM